MGVPVEGQLYALVPEEMLNVLRVDAEISVMNADGSEARRLADTRAFEFGPDWQPLAPTP